MARPKRGNYATGEAGNERYKKALREYLKKTKKPEVKPEVKKPVAKKPVAKKPVAKKPATKKPAAKKPVAKKPPVKKPVTKKPVAKKPVTKKPVAKKPVAKKPAGKVPAKKPLISNKNKLRIKKAATTAKDTTVKTAKTVAKKAGEAKKAVTKKVASVKKALKKGKAPKPTTGPQKFVSKVTRGAKSYGKTLLKKGGKDLLKIGKGIAKNPGSAVAGLKGAGAAYLAEKGINQLTDRAFKQLRKETRGKNMTLKEYRARKDKAAKELRKKYGIIPTAKKLVNKVRGKSGESSTTKNINKQKKVNNQTVKKQKTNVNSQADKLKIAKQRVSKAKGYNKEKLQREVRYLEKFGKQGRTWSNPVGAKGNNQPSSVKVDKTSSGKKMHAIEKRNRERFGDAHVDRLKAKHAEWKKRRKKK